MGFFPSLRRKVLLPAPQLNDRVPPYLVPPGQVGKPYRESWDLQRAIEFGMEQNVWVYRCVNKIANSAAQLPMIMRQTSPIDGPPVDHPMLDIFNFQSSLYESALIFRKRLSQVLLLNKQGVFIEVIKNRMGLPAALYILPPGFTWPIPNEQTFVSAYRIQYPGKSWIDVPAENVVWIREPHPSDPYTGQTPLEAAGLSIETDYYMRLYRRQFLMNDARPGGILLVNGQMDEFTMVELKRRFSGTMGYGPGGAGRVTVMQAEDGQYLDMSQNARDMQYAEGTSVTKQEILLAFGVPESVLGNAAERTYANAEAEQYNFWMETMMPHLNTLARALDILDPDPKLFLSYDLSRVTALTLPERDEKNLMLQEVNANVISRDEYRLKSGRDPVGQGASKLYNQSMLVEIADTTPAMQPDRDRNPNAFYPSLVETSRQRMIDVKAAQLEHQTGSDHRSVVVSVFPPDSVQDRLQRQLGLEGKVHVNLVNLGSTKHWDPLDLNDVQETVANFCREEKDAIAGITALAEYKVDQLPDGRPEVKMVSNDRLEGLRERLWNRLSSQGLAPREG